MFRTRYTKTLYILNIYIQLHVPTLSISLNLDAEIQSLTRVEMFGVWIKGSNFN